MSRSVGGCEMITEDGGITKDTGITEDDISGITVDGYTSPFWRANGTINCDGIYYCTQIVIC